MILAEAIPYIGPATLARRTCWPESQFVFLSGTHLLTGFVRLDPAGRDALHGVPIARFAYGRPLHDEFAPDWDVVHAAPYLMAQFHKLRALAALANRRPA